MKRLREIAITMLVAFIAAQAVQAAAPPATERAAAEAMNPFLQWFVDIYKRLTGAQKRGSSLARTSASTASVSSDPIGTFEFFQYDASGRLVRIESRLGEDGSVGPLAEETYSYDNANNRTGRQITVAPPP